MIDTVMVVWTSGIWKRLLCATITFLLLFACVGILSFLVTTGGKWSSLAATITSTQPSSSTQSSLFTQPDTATQAGASTAIALAQPAPTARPKVTPYTVPVILQNPIRLEATPVSKSTTRHISSYYRPPAHTRPTSIPTPSDAGLQDPTNNALQNLP